jgi:DNA-directed RNA polymerase subunit alpha
VYEIPLPSKLKVVSEEKNKGVYEISGLYPGYGHTLGNSLRRIIFSSLPGYAITTVKIEGVNHEFSTIPGVKEDVINIILNLKRIRFKMHTNEPQTFSTTIKKEGEFKAKHLNIPSQVEIMNPENIIATITNRKTEISIELTVEKGLGYVSSENLKKERMPIGVMVIDAIFTPIRKINYEVENMRVGDRTDYNLLRFFIETDGSLTPREAIDKSLEIMLKQLKSLIGETETASQLKEKEKEELLQTASKKEIEKALLDADQEQEKEIKSNAEDDPLKIRVEDLEFSSRTLNALSFNSIRTVGGLVKKKEEDLLALEGIGKKAIKEIKHALGKLGLTLR